MSIFFIATTVQRAASIFQALWNALPIVYKRRTHTSKGHRSSFHSIIRMTFKVLRTSWVSYLTLCENHSWPKISANPNSSCPSSHLWLWAPFSVETISLFSQIQLSHVKTKMRTQLILFDSPHPSAQTSWYQTLACSGTRLHAGICKVIFKHVFKKIWSICNRTFLVCMLWLSSSSSFQKVTSAQLDGYKKKKHTENNKY